MFVSGVGSGFFLPRPYENAVFASCDLHGVGCTPHSPPSQCFVPMLSMLLVFIVFMCTW